MLSYVGRLEETDTGIDRSPRYSPYIKKGGIRCRVYIREGSQLYIARKIGGNNYTYARCRFYSS